MDRDFTKYLPFALGGLVLVAITRWIRTWLRLRHIPGPFSVGLSRLWVLKRSLQGSLHIETDALAKKYGSLVRVGPNEVITSSPEDWRKVFGVRTLYTRGDWYDCVRFDPEHDHVVSVRDENVHVKLRAKMASGYSGKDNENLESIVDENITNLITLLETKYLSTQDEYKPVEFAKKTMYFTTDIISQLAFGKAFGDLAQDQDVYSYIATTKQALSAAMILTVYPWIMNVLRSRLLRGLLPSDKDVLGMGKVMGLAKETVAERFGPNKKVQKDMLGSFIRHGLTQREAEAETLIQIVAGTDTTAGAIRAIILYIITNPRVYALFLEEIASSTISSPVLNSEARKMPYLQAVIKEGLRIYPPVSGAGYREVPAGGDTLSGYFVPEKTNVGYNMFRLFHDPKLWGTDAKIFRPERWIGRDPETTKRMDANIDLIFGYGRWKCLGYNIAWMELNKIFVELLRRFDFAVANPEQPWKTYTASVNMTSDFWVTITKREKCL